jgi:hypothetical protein
MNKPRRINELGVGDLILEQSSLSVMTVVEINDEVVSILINMGNRDGTVKLTWSKKQIKLFLREKIWKRYPVKVRHKIQER